MKRIRNRIIIFVLLCSLGSGNVAFCQNGQDEAKEFYARGNELYKQGKYKEAQEEFSKAIEIMSRKETAEPPVVSVAQVPPATLEPGLAGGKPAKPEPLAVAPVPAVPQGKEETQSQKKTDAQPKPQAPAGSEYLLGEDDALQITVWQNPDLNQEVIVRPDGKISFPLIGDVQASGLTISQLSQAITDKLKEFVLYPEVSIFLRKLGGKKVIILGEVQGPGVYSVTGARTILEAVGLAGGFTRDAVPSSTLLIRNGFSKPMATRINLSRALSGDLRQNVVLQSEDVIFIPKKFIADLNYFLTQVMQPLQSGQVPYSSIMFYRSYIRDLKRN